jgi:antiviral helicase SKI2
LLRKPGAKGDFARGRAGQFPFAPGGLEVVSEDGDESSRYRINEKTQLGPLPSIPPGFTRGLRVKSTEEDVELETTELNDEEDNGIVVRSVHLNKVDSVQKETVPRAGFEGIDDLLPEEV